MVRADEATRFKPGVGQPKLRAQRLKALHGWLTCGSMMSGKPCRSLATKKDRCRLHGGASGSGGLLATTASGPKPRLRSGRNSATCLLKMLRDGLA
jgi:hypothetical protein